MGIVLVEEQTSPQRLVDVLICVVRHLCLALVAQGKSGGQKWLASRRGQFVSVYTSTMFPLPNFLVSQGDV